MNVELYDQLVDMFDFITNPLWEFFNDSYNGYQGGAFIGAILLGLIACTYPSQISYHLSAITYTANQMAMATKPKWWSTPLSFFLGKLVAVYLIVILSLATKDDWLTRFLEEVVKLSGPLLFVLGLSFIVSIHIARFRRKIESLSAYQGFIISFGLSLFIDPGVILIFDIYISWIQQYFLGWIIPFFYVSATFVPVLVFSILAYGFHLDTFLVKKANKKVVQYYFGMTLIVLAINQFILYWG